MLERLGKWLDYLGYLFNSTNRHGIHSPFVYSFADLVLYKSDTQNFESIEYQRTLMIQSTGKINKDSISYFVDNYTLNSKYCKLLNRISTYYGVSNIREFGWCSGIETNYLLHSFVHNPRILSYKYYNNEVNRIKEQCNQDFWENYQLSSNLEIVDLAKDAPTLFLFHWSYFNENEFWKIVEKICTDLKNNDIVVINGLRNSTDTIINFNRLKRDSCFNVSIDLFELGIFFKRIEQPKQDFILRF